MSDAARLGSRPPSPASCSTPTSQSSSMCDSVHSIHNSTHASVKPQTGSIILRALGISRASQQQQLRVSAYAPSPTLPETSHYTTSTSLSSFPLQDVAAEGPCSVTLPPPPLSTTSTYSSSSSSISPSSSSSSGRPRQKPSPVVKATQTTPRRGSPPSPVLPPTSTTTTSSSSNSSGLPSGSTLPATAAAAAAAVAAEVVAGPASVSEVSKARSYIPLTAAAAAAVAKVYDDTSALVASVPRTLRTLTWAVRAGISYKQLLVTKDPYDMEEYNKNMTKLHDIWGKVSSRRRGGRGKRQLVKVVYMVIKGYIILHHSTRGHSTRGAPAAEAAAAMIKHFCFVVVRSSWWMRQSSLQVQ